MFNLYDLNLGLKRNKEIIILLGIAIFVWIINFILNFRGLVFPDALYYASIARNIVSGQGYTANFVNASWFTYLGKNIFIPPINPPLFPYLLALFFKIGGVSAHISAFLSGFFFLITIIPLYLLANKLFGRIAAIIASVAYIFEPTMLMFSISGLTEPVFVFFLLMAFLFLAKFLENEKMPYLFYAGIFMGLCKLTRFNASVFIIIIIVTLLLFIKEKRLKAVLIFGIGIVLVHIPEFVRVLLVKTPALSQGMINYAALDGTEQYPCLTITRVLNPMSSWEFICVYPKQFFYKYFHALFYYYKNIFVMANPIVTALFTVSLISFKPDRLVRIFLFILGLAIIAQIGLISYSTTVIRYFYIFIPFILIFGIGFFFEFIYPSAELPSKKIFVFLLVLLFLLPTANVYRTLLWDYGLLLRNYESEEAVMIKQQKAIGEFIKKNTKKDDFIATDYTSIAWYANRKTLFLPVSFNTLQIIDSKYMKVDAILLTSKSYIKDVEKLTGEAKNLVVWKNILSFPPKKLGEYVLFKQGKIKGEKFVFYKRK